MIRCSGLKAKAGKRYHLGIRNRAAAGTLTRVTKSRDYRYEDFAFLLIKQAKNLYLNDDKLDVNLKGMFL